MKLSITRALNELSLLDSRIMRECSQATFATVKTVEATKVMDGRKTVEEFEIEVKAKFQSISDLIARRNTIKSLIVASNADTKVMIGGVEYTVASAIERKSTIGYNKTLVAQLRKSLSDSLVKVSRANDTMESKINEMVISLLGKDASKSGKEDAVAQATAIGTNYRVTNTTVMVDPLGLTELVEKMTNDIEVFESEVDYILSESNAITQIEIND